MAKVVIFNCIVALIVYLFMIASGLIEWSSISSAIMVGFGYPALLKSTLMQNKMGESIGLADHYDKYLRQLNDKIMENKYRHEKSLIDYIAMTNSPVRMEDTLNKIYRNASPARMSELRQELSDELNSTTDSIGRRIVLARRIKRRHDLDELVKRRFLPDFDLADLIGPDEVLLASLNHCEKTGKTLLDLEQDFNCRLESLKQRHRSERAEVEEKEVKEWLKRAQTDRGDMRCYLRWLCMQENFNIPKLIILGYLPQKVQNWNNQQWTMFTKSIVDQELQNE